jgi:hypothetical protein
MPNKLIMNFVNAPKLVSTDVSDLWTESCQHWGNNMQWDSKQNGMGDINPQLIKTFSAEDEWIEQRELKRFL